MGSSCTVAIAYVNMIVPESDAVGFIDDNLGHLSIQRKLAVRKYRAYVSLCDDT